MMTVRFSPAAGGAETLRSFLKNRLAELPNLRGMTGAHLLQTKTPDAKPTEEQKIRGGDAVADWILLLSGYDARELLEAGKSRLSPRLLIEAGAMPSASYAMFDLAYTLTPSDL